MGGKYKYTRKGKIWREIELPYSGLTLAMAKPKQSNLRNLRHATPKWNAAVLAMQEFLLLSKEEKEAHQPEEIVVPGEELEQISLFLARTCVDVYTRVESEEGVTKEPVLVDDDSALVWRNESLEERQYFIETLPFGDQTHAWGQLAGALYGEKAARRVVSSMPPDEIK